MRASLSYLTSTSSTAPATAPDAGPHELEMLGLHRGHRAVYLLEHLPWRTPVLHVLHLGGEHAGRLVPVRSWYEGDDDEIAAGFAARLAALRAELTPLEPIDNDAWTLSTRVIQHRALRFPDGRPPIRKYVLALVVEAVVEPIEDQAPTRGRAVVTAYLRPRAALDQVWAVPGEALAVARLSYVGVPSELGHDKQTAVLVSRPLH